MRTQPLVSVIIPVYNRSGLLLKSVQSVLDQNYDFFEVIIIDDGSTDDTLQQARFLAEKHPSLITVLDQENSGPGVAREKGRKHAKGDFIQYLDSDDILHADKFTLQVDALMKHPDCDVAYGLTSCGPPEQAFKGKAWKRTGEKIESIFPAMIANRWWGTSTPLYRKPVLDKIGPWSAAMNEEDWEYDCRLGALGIRLAFVDAFVSHENHHDGVRLSQDSLLSYEKSRDRLWCRSEILKSMNRAKVAPPVVERQHFANECFLLARQFGQNGYANLAKDMYDLAAEAGGSRLKKNPKYFLYGVCAKIFGWRLSGRLVRYLRG